MVKDTCYIFAIRVLLCSLLTYFVYCRFCIEKFCSSRKKVYISTASTLLQFIIIFKYSHDFVRNPSQVFGPHCLSSGPKVKPLMFTLALQTLLTEVHRQMCRDHIRSARQHKAITCGVQTGRCGVDRIPISGYRHGSDTELSSCHTTSSSSL